jgi:hypothetical protein
VRKPVEIANATEAVHDARFCIERINEKFLKAVDHQPKRGRHRARHRQRLAMAPRERHLREVHQASADLFT